MAIINKKQSYQFSIDKMFAIISDYNSYPSFIDACISSNSEKLDNNKFLVKQKIGAKSVNVDYTSIVTLYPYNSINMKASEGPFSKMEGQWTLHKIDDNSCSIELNIDYSFKLLFKILSSSFEESMLELFNILEERANQLYSS